MSKTWRIVIFILILFISLTLASIFYYKYIRPMNKPKADEDITPDPENVYVPDPVFTEGVSLNSGKKAYSLYDGVALLDNDRRTLTQEEKDSGVALHKVRTLVKDEFVGTVTGENPAREDLGLGATYMVDGKYLIGIDKVKFIP